MTKVIKRNGRIVDFDINKLIKVTLWACDNRETIAYKLVNELEYKLNDVISIQDLYNELIKTAVNNISAVTPYYDDIAKKLLLLKLYKETWGLKRTGAYPHIRDVLTKGALKGIYSSDIVEYILSLGITDELNSMIEPDRDMLFNYKGLQLFFDKYCKKKP